MLPKQITSRFTSIFLFSLLCVYSSALLGATPHEVTDESRIQRITGLLDGAAIQMRATRKQVGANFLGMGLAFAGAGGIILASTDNVGWTNYGKIGLAMGTTFALTGGIFLLIRSPFERPASELLAQTDEHSKADRLAAYEKAFRQLAEDERDARRSNAWLALGLGAAAVSTVVLLWSSDLLLTIGTGWVGLGVVSLFTLGPYESQFADYQTWRAGNHRSENPSGFKLGIVPHNQGGSVFATLSF